MSNSNDDHETTAHWASGDAYNYTHGESHDFAAHAEYNLGANVLAPDQEQYGGFAKLSDYSYIGRSPITGLRPVIEQAVDSFIASYGSISAAVTAYGSNDALESAVAAKITTLNDWSDLTTETQNKIMIMTGINFDAMSTEEQEDSINHLQHSPLPFGAIEEVLSTSAVIDLGFTHTLEKDDTEVVHLGNGIYEINMISNNGAGSHTGHILGSFKIDMSSYGREDLDGQYAVSATSNSTYSTPSTNNGYATGAPDNTPLYSYHATTDDLVVELTYNNPTYVSGLEISGTTSYHTGEIKQIELKDADDVWHVVWTGSETSTTSEPLVNISFDATDFLSNEARITIDAGTGSDYEAIDAVKLLAPPLDEDDGGGRFDQAKELGNAMVTHTNTTSQLYLEQSARDILYGNTEDTEFGHPEHGEGSGQSHSFVDHASEFYADALIKGQAETGGYVYLNDSYIVGRNTITGLQPVVEQAISQVKAATPSLTGDALERAIAKKITELNDWSSLTEETQAKLMIMTGINFDGMTTEELEETINHLLHSPLPFGEIEEVLNADVKIDLGYTHTLDKDETTSVHLGDGIYEVRMISNNGTGSHTGHVLGSFKIDMNDYPREDPDGQYAIAVTSNSTYGTASSNNNAATGAPDNTPWYGNYNQTVDFVLNLSYSSPTYVSGLEISGTTSYATGTITKIELQDPDGDWHTVWTGSEASTTSDTLVRINFDATDFLSNEARVTIDGSNTSNYEAIDAVKLIAPPVDGDDGSAREAQAIEVGNAMVTHTNDNTNLYLDHAARDVLYGNVDAADYTMGNAYQSATNALNHVHGGAGDDNLEGTDGNDHIDAGAGVDVITGSAGNDTIIGGYGEYNQINYAGSVSEYTFVKNHDGTYTVTKPNGTDTVSAVSSFWFIGDQKSYTGDQLVAGVYSNPHDATIVGSTGEDNVQGTDGDDVIDLRAGVDVVRGSAGNDTIYGGDNGYNQINYGGSAADYTFIVNEGGSITVVKPNGTDTLHDITGLWFEGEAKWYSPDQAAAAYPTPEAEAPTIEGTEDNDHIEGTSSNDNIAAGGGVDVIVGSAGDDTINGGNGEYNQINYTGTSSQYSFVKNHDGTLTITKPNGTDTVSGVTGFWFIGEGKWYSAEQLVAGVYTNPNNATIVGSTGDDYLQGTDGNDIIDLRAGVDVVRGSAGNDTIYGGDNGYNQINYAGSAADYKFEVNEDGSITVVKANGTDTLHGITGLWFEGEGKWYAPDQAASAYPIPEVGEPTIVGTAGDDSEQGTAGDDYFSMADGNDLVFGSAGNDIIDAGAGDYDQVEYAGNRADYTFTQNEDGSYTVVKPNGTDTLTGVETIWFAGDQVWSVIGDLVEGGSSGGGFGETEEADVIHSTVGDDTINALGGNDEIIGSTGNDTIDGGSGTNQIDYAGSSADYTVTKNENGSYTVVKPDGTDTLTNIDAVYFFGDELWSTIDDLVEGGSEETGPGEGDDVIFGTDGDDNFNGLGGSDEFFGSAGNDTLHGGEGTEYDQIDYYGSSSDYAFSQNEDGSYTVVSEADGTDLLINIEGVYFFGDEVLAEIEDLI